MRINGAAAALGLDITVDCSQDWCTKFGRSPWSKQASPRRDVCYPEGSSERCGLSSFINFSAPKSQCCLLVSWKSWVCGRGSHNYRGTVDTSWRVTQLLDSPRHKLSTWPVSFSVTAVLPPCRWSSMRPAAGRVLPDGTTVPDRPEHSLPPAHIRIIDLLNDRAAPTAPLSSMASA